MLPNVVVAAGVEEYAVLEETTAIVGAASSLASAAKLESSLSSSLIAVLYAAPAVTA